MKLKNVENRRILDEDVDSMFPDRWSPRSFSTRKVPDEHLMSLFEAARWSPSCRNEQPWLFLYAKRDDDLELFRKPVNEENRKWADKAPVLIYLLARRRFRKNEKENDYALFDCGAAWMALALQSRKLGLYSHAMAGFDKESAHQVLEIPKQDFEIPVVMAVGYRDEPESLPQGFRERESPTPRIALSQIAFERQLRH